MVSDARRSTEILAQLELTLDVTARLGSCSLAMQQMVAIARAVDISAKVLILDEPTSSLDSAEVAQLFRVIRRLRDSGVAVLFVSHFLDQVYEIADRMTVLRNGRRVGEYQVSELPQVELVSKMIGKEIETLETIDGRARQAVVRNADSAVLAAEEIGRRGAIAPFSLTIHAGEVVGLAGLLGSGRTELARLLFGADRADHGRLRVGGKVTQLRNPRSAIARHLAFCSEDRRQEGLVTELTVRENIVLALQAVRGWSRPIPRRVQDELVERYLTALNIRPADPELRVADLSGGNQQKVMLARWLITEPRLLIVDEPTVASTWEPKPRSSGCWRSSPTAGWRFFSSVRNWRRCFG